MADGEATAGGVLKSSSGLLGMVPYVGPILSMAASIGGGALEMDAAKKQQEQAAKARKDALGLKPDALNPEFAQKLQADKMAELSGLPGLPLWKQMLEAKTATDLRSIRESSPDGASTLNALSAVSGNANEAVNKLAISDMEYKAKMGEVTRNDLWNIGGLKRANEDKRDVWKREGLQAASALENAATANKMGGINTILGAIGSTATSIGSNATTQSGNPDISGLFANYFGNSKDASGNAISANPLYKSTESPNPYLFNQRMWNPQSYNNFTVK